MASFKEYLNQLCFDCISRLLITVYGFLLFLESIPLPKACASHIEKILSKSPET
jgi:hypothetical protein